MVKGCCYLTSYGNPFPFPHITFRKTSISHSCFYLNLSGGCIVGTMTSQYGTKGGQGYGYPYYADEKCWWRSHNTGVKGSHGNLGQSDSHAQVWESIMSENPERGRPVDLDYYSTMRPDLGVGGRRCVVTLNPRPPVIS